MLRYLPAARAIPVCAGVAEKEQLSEGACDSGPAPAGQLELEAALASILIFEWHTLENSFELLAAEG
jgi:hypothetical protein